MLRDHDADLYAKECTDGTVIFWFRHRAWNRNESAICQITSRDEAARFIWEQFTKPGLFSGRNHKGLSRVLPEVYGISSLVSRELNPRHNKPEMPSALEIKKK